MKIIFEGPNSSGKSTLVKLLKSLNMFSDFESEYLGKNTPKDYKFYEYLLLNKRNIIFDRSCISECVYSNIHKRDTEMTLNKCLDLFNKVGLHEKVIIIFVDAEFEFIVNGYNRKQESVDFEFIKRERASFNNVMIDFKEYCYNCAVIHLFNTVNDNDTFIKLLNEVLDCVE